MFGIGAGELVIVAIVLLIAVGPGKMPGFMKAVGKGMREFRRASRELRKQSGIDELMREDALGVRELQREIQRAGREPAPRREQKLTSEDLRREQPPEGVDIVHARALAVQKRTAKKIAERDANRDPESDPDRPELSEPDPVPVAVPRERMDEE